LNFGTEIIIT